MPNYASEENQNSIKDEIKKVSVDYFTANKASQDEIINVYVENLTKKTEYPTTDYVLDDIKNFDFVNEKDKNHPQQNELKEMFADITKSAKEFAYSRDAFDYDEWNQKIGDNLNAFKDKLDAFNEATDYEHINNPKMHALNAYVNKLGQLNLSIQNYEYKDRIEEVQNDVNTLAEQNTTLENHAKEYMSYCQENDLPPDNMDANYRKVKDACHKMENIRNTSELTAEILDDRISDLEPKQEFVKASINFQNSLLEFRILDDTHNDLNEHRYELEQKSLNLIYSQPKEVSAAYETLVDLDNFNRDHPAPKNENELPGYKQAFLEANPENKDTDDLKYRSSIESMSNEELQNHISRIGTDARQKFDTIEPSAKKECLDLFEDLKNTKDKIGEISTGLKENAADIQSTAEALKMTNQKVKLAPNISEYIKRKSDEVKGLSPEEVKKQLQKTAPIAKNPSFELPQLTACKEEKAAFQDALNCSNKGYASLGKELDKLNTAGKKSEEIARDERKISFSQSRVEKGVDSIEPKQQLGKSFLKDIDRFISQSDKCRRWGHRDSPEFLAMQKAVKDAKENLTVDNIKKMKEAADDYLAKKGSGNFFNTKMRQHRKDLANAISDFAGKCSSFEDTVSKADKVVKNAHTTAAKDAKEVFDSIKENYQIKDNAKLKEQLSEFRSINDKYTAAQKKAEKALQKEVKLGTEEKKKNVETKKENRIRGVGRNVRKPSEQKKELSEKSNSI